MTAAVVAIVAIVGMAAIATPGGRGAFTTSSAIARVHIDGLICSDNDRVEVSVAEQAGNESEDGEGEANVVKRKRNGGSVERG